MYIKIHKSYRNVVAMCDADIVGKYFDEDKRQLDLRENFFKDKKVDHEEAILMLQQLSNEDSTFNIVGKKSVQAAIDAGLITSDSVDTIDNIPFTLILL
jgi:hypothetical protein